jgi:chromosomal replication initiation ATPase DnaA
MKVLPAGDGQGRLKHIEVQAGTDISFIVAELISEVAKIFEVSLDDVRSPCQRREPARARAAVAHLAVKELGLSGKAVAAALRVSPSAVSHALHRGRVVVEDERIRVVSAQPALGGQKS